MREFKRIVNEYKSIVYNHAYYFTGNREDAEDITQEVFIRLWNNLDDIKSEVLKFWILKVTKNLCIDFTRKRKKYVSFYKDDDESEPVWETLVDTEQNPEQKAISQGIRENIHRFINLLPNTIRSVVIMRDIQDLEYNLIAETMELPLNSVKAYIHRGRKLLMKYLVQYSKDDFIKG